MAAFHRSVALGYRYLETDVRASRDGVLYCFHDRSLNRTTGVNGLFRDLDARELAQLNVDGEPLCTIEEALRELPDTYFSIDLKHQDALWPMVRLLQRHPDLAQRVCLAGAWDGWLRLLRREIPHVATALGWRSLFGLVLGTRSGGGVPWWVADATFAHVPYRVGALTTCFDELVIGSHERGIRVLVWTVNDPDEIHSVLDLGVDAVVTDRPDTLREVLIARGEWTAMTPPTQSSNSRHNGG